MIHLVVIFLVAWNVTDMSTCSSMDYFTLGITLIAAIQGWVL